MITINSTWVKSFHILYIVVWTLIEVSSGALSDSLKYLFLFIPIVICCYLIVMNKFRIKPETLVFGQHLLYIVFFLAITIFALLVNDELVLNLKDIGRLIFPAMYAFLLLNTDSTENKDFYVDTIFIACTLVVIYTSWSRFSIANFLAIDFFTSKSPFESYLAQEYAFLFIYYYQRKKPGRFLAAVLLSYMTLKRIHFLFVILILVFGYFIRNVKVTNKKINILKAVFFLSPVIMQLLISETFVNWFDTTFNTSFYMFTMGRLNQITTLMRYDGSLLGLQAVEQYLKRTGWVIICHSDIIRIYLETTIVGLVLYVNAFFNLAKINRNIYALLAIILMLFSMFASVNLARLHTYLVLYFICCVDFDKAAAEDALKKASRHTRSSFLSINTGL